MPVLLDMDNPAAADSPPYDGLIGTTTEYNMLLMPDQRNPPPYGNGRTREND